MYCHNCGKLNEDHATFCSECGKSLKSNTSPNVNIEDVKEKLSEATNDVKKLYNSDKQYIFHAVGVIIGTFILSYILIYLIRYFFYEYANFISIIIGLASNGGLILGIYMIIKKLTLNDLLKPPIDETFENVPLLHTNSITQFNQNKNIPNMPKTNKIVKLTFTGGIIGLIGGNETKKLKDTIAIANKDNWNVVQIIPDNSGNILTLILRVVLLVFTLFFFTFNNGYYLIFEKEI